ncbi:MAG: o-succinylbenzoate synthase [Nitrososphaerota archaeon]|nr:o-succinylbenzoate synthase [Nitrososphaerota archaeon]MDG6967501.1 o-succinylbenzoate synthase [Nitrososphaerota archaeon]MDG6978954.1 o-succinylbenzoate synthase [Nitrososphaerota archaeon]
MHLRVRHVKTPLRSPFSNSAGSTVARSALILELEHGGVTALSECVAGDTPSFTGEDNATALRDIRGFAGHLRDGPTSPDEFLERTERVEGRQMAKAAVEMVLWDYLAKRAGRPLDRALGRSRGYAETGIAIGLEDPSRMVSEAKEAVARGYKRVKVKVARKGGVEALRRLREALPEFPLSADANGCFSFPGDLPALKEIDRFGLVYLEQPLGFGDLEGHARLAKEVSTPICLDETVLTLEGAEDALRIGAAEVINVKPGRVGGLSVAMEIARMARGRRAHAWVGGMLETGVGRASNVALASQPEFDYPGDTSPNDRYFERDIVRNPFEMRAGRLAPGEGPGIGVVVDAPALEAFTVGTWELL